MIKNIIEIPITQESYPFTSADRYLDLSKYGYVEKEYYMKGIANVYKSVGNRGCVEIKDTDVPYTNRFIVRAPEDISKFSGHVVVEIINPTSFMEIERMWILAWRKFVRNGDIYVGITSKPNTIDKLVEFNANRYSCLSWPNPTPEIPFDFTLEEALAHGNLPDIKIDYEPGLFWDMLTDLAWMLRGKTNLNPLLSYTPKYIHLTGWSQSACYLYRYVNSFAYREEVKKDGCVFDGYLAAGAPRHFIIPVNQYESNMDYHSCINRCEYMEQPFIAIHTESENSLCEGYHTEVRDSDLWNMKYRYYEVTGASHDTQYSLIDYYQNDEDLIRINHLPHYNGQHKESNNYPSEVLFQGAYRNLFKWVEEGMAPATCPRIEIDGQGNNRKDAFGNTMGGLRTCLINYPTAMYTNFSTVPLGKSIVDPNSDQDILFGHQESFPKEMLKYLYKSLDNYRDLCIKDTQMQVSKGFICKEDAQYLVDIAVNYAKERGLK